jgi:single-stranded DNA-binding protein
VSGIETAFLGSVVREAERKVSKNVKPYLRFTARVGDGDQAQFVSVMYFGDDAAELRMAQGTRVYVEGSLRLDKWEKDGQPRSGLSVMSFHARIAEIGRNRPKRQRKPSITTVDVATPSSAASPSGRGNFYDDSIPFAAEWRG